MAVMREPRVATAQRTMIYMAISLALHGGRADAGLSAAETEAARKRHADR